MKRYYRVDEVAGMFGVHTRTVRRWLEEQRTPMQTLPNSRPLRIVAETVDIFVATGFSKNVKSEK